MNIGICGTRLGRLGSQNRRRPSGWLWLYGSLVPAPYVPAISAPWVKGLFGTHMLHTLCCGKNIGVYGQVWGDLVPRNEGVPLADCDFMAVWTLHPMYQQYRLPGSNGYLVHTCYISPLVEWILAYMAKFGVPWFEKNEGVLRLCTSNIGSLGQRAIWYTHVTYPLLWNEYWHIWPSLGCLGSQKRRRPCGRLRVYCIPDTAPYVPAIPAPWVKGLFGTHMLHTLCCGMNIGVYGQVWGSLVPRNEGVPLADCDFMAVWTLHPMYQQYRLPGSKGYLVHTCYIPSVVELILAYMARFGVPWFPETKASLWPIVILWQSGPCTPCTSNIGSLGRRAIWYTHFTYPLLWNEYWRIWPSLGCLGSQKRRRPSGRLWFYGSLVPAPNVPAISAPWVKGLFGKHMLHTLCCGMNIWHKVGTPWFPESKSSLWKIMILWQCGPCTPRTSNIGSLGQRAIWYTHVTYPLLWNKYWRIWHKFGVPLFPETKVSLWQIMNLWQSWPCTLCTSNIGSQGQRAIWYTHAHTLCCGMNIGVYSQVWGSLVPRNEGVPLADCHFLAVWTLHPMYQQYRLPGSTGYLVHTFYIPSVVEWILAYMAKFGVPWFPETKASLWQIVILWQSGPCLGCLGSQKRRRPSGRLWFYGSLDPAPYVPAILAPWVKGLFGTHMLHTLCYGMNIGVYGQVWGALVPRNEGVPLADYEFMVVWTLHPMYQKYRLPGSKSYLEHTCYIPSVMEWILAYMAKFGMPWFPETKASLRQIVILWQSGPCTLCTSNIGSLGQRAIWYTDVTYPLLWNEYWRIWPSLGCLGAQKRRRPSGRLWFYGSLDPAPNVPTI